MKLAKQNLKAARRRSDERCEWAKLHVQIAEACGNVGPKYLIGCYQTLGFQPSTSVRTAKTVTIQLNYMHRWVRFSGGQPRESDGILDGSRVFMS